MGIKRTFTKQAGAEAPALRLLNLTGRTPIGQREEIEELSSIPPPFEEDR
jgi:hypothetical protein